MRWNISGAPVPSHAAFSDVFIAAAAQVDIPSCVPYAIKCNENAQNDCGAISFDGGHGLMQLTAEYPGDWADPMANVVYAIRVYIVPAITYWNAVHGFTGDALLRCIFAEYNAGRSATLAGHVAGNVDFYTTNNYAARALTAFRELIAGRTP